MPVTKAIEGLVRVADNAVVWALVSRVMRGASQEVREEFERDFLDVFESGCERLVGRLGSSELEGKVSQETIEAVRDRHDRCASAVRGAYLDYIRRVGKGELGS